MAEDGTLPAKRRRRKAPALAASGAIEPHFLQIVAAVPQSEATQRLLHHGPGALTDNELVSIFLGGDRRNSDVSAEDLLHLLGGVQGLTGLDLEIARAQSLTDQQTLHLLAAVELGRRFRLKPDRALRLSDPNEVAGYLVGHFHATSDQQVLGVLFADDNNRGLGFVECFRGTQTRLNIDTKPILREALCRKAASLLVFWFRPSIQPVANSQDFEFREKLSVACKCLGFDLLDFLLLSSESWLSLRRLKPW